MEQSKSCQDTDRREGSPSNPLINPDRALQRDTEKPDEHDIQNPSYVSRSKNDKKITPSKLVKDGPLTIYEPVSKITSENKKLRIATREIGIVNHSFPAPGKVLMVVGATGSGKTTLINGLTNYVYGVKWDDCFRYKLIDDEGDHSQTNSQTTWITAYTLHKTAGSILPYTLTVIDTPGFGDTRGIKRDKEIADQIKELFTNSKNHAVDQLHGIVFVVQAYAVRLTPTQKYIFDAILSIFGRDIANNIILVATFADNKKPPVYKAVSEANVPYQKAFKFNNSALYPSTDSEDPDHEYDEFEDKRYWEMGERSYSTFFTEFITFEPQSLYLTREVLKEREHLEETVSGLQPQIQRGLAKIDVLKQERRILQEHEAQINDCKDFTYKVNEQRHCHVTLKPGEIITNCLICHTTCHFPCKIAINAEKSRCAAMNSNGTCNVCPRHCSWNEHFNTPYRYEIFTVEVERTSEDLKARYENAVGGKTQKEKIIAGMEIEMQELIEKVHDMISDARLSIQRLKEIALKPNPMTEVEYIELLIESEKSENASGFQERIKVLMQFRRKAVLLSKIGTCSEEKKGLFTVLKGLAEEVLNNTDFAGEAVFGF